MIGEERQRTGGGYATFGVARNGDCHREHGVGETEGERMGSARGEAGMSMTRASHLQLSDKNRNFHEDRTTSGGCSRRSAGVA